MTDLNRDIILSHLESTEEFIIDFNDGWVWLEHSTKGNAKRHFEKAGFVEGIDFEVFIQNDKNPKGSKGGRPSETIMMTVDCFKMWAMMTSTAKGNEVRRWYIQIEKELRQLKAKPKSQLEILQEAVNQLVEQEQRLKALEQEQEVQRLEIEANCAELDRFRNGHGYWYTIVAWCNLQGLTGYSLSEFNLLGRQASALCKKRNIKPEKVKDSRFGTVNSYPDSVLKDIDFNLS
ncbi:antA/AntB antirepressor family protein [Moorena sp. SIO3A2]|uniref:antA/AntB antirepressor family protein n=1 Tax=Moorena sp. SIO3A2 TaxID=2607841 RepID=UPI0013B915BB|nr:antA/AntB antirepressor family protein [Moorena sp. SIO3A2]NER90402.1 hypothetical protein [Moorena sp. SIO3A2]